LTISTRGSPRSSQPGPRACPSGRNRPASPLDRLHFAPRPGENPGRGERPMDIANKIGSLVREASSEKEGIARALDAILDATNTTSGTVHVMPPGEDVMHLMASRDIPEFVLDKVRTIPIGKGMAGVAVEKRQPVTTCNLQTDDAGGIIRQGARA